MGMSGMELIIRIAIIVAALLLLRLLRKVRRIIRILVCIGLVIAWILGEGFWIFG